MPEREPIPEAPNLVIPWPTMPPFGFNVSADGLKEAWDAVWAPIYEGEQSIEHRIIAGALRAVFDGMHGITRDTERSDGDASTRRV